MTTEDEKKLYRFLIRSAKQGMQLSREAYLKSKKHLDPGEAHKFYMAACAEAGRSLAFEEVLTWMRENT